jgi:uncharacterized sulfatase
MKRTPAVIFLVSLLLTPLVTLPAAEAPQSARRPNIVFILADDLGWADLPVYGNRFNEAPNLTRLAAGGMRFTDAYAAAPVCSPTRASIMAGQYPARVGIIDFIPGHWRPYEKVTVPSNRTQYLPAEIVTMAEALQTAGYATALFGKWHLGDQREHHPSKQGFDVANVGSGYFNVQFNPPRKDSAAKISAERLADFGIDFIERNKARPFFLFLAPWEVHVQFDAEQARIDKFLKKPAVADYPCHAVYAAMIEQLDHSVGRVLAKLDALGLRDNTLVVFFSDNGGQISNDRYPGVEDAKLPLLVPSKRSLYRGHPLDYLATANTPLRGEKGTLYEGGIREPLIMSWPGRIKPGSVCATPVTSVDFYPTFLELAGAAKPAGQVLDGQSLLPVVLNGAADPERALYWHYPVYHHDVPAAAVRKGPWKLLENLAAGNITLYHLPTDLGETTDLAGVFPAQARELHALLKRWQADVRAEFPRPNPAFDAQRRFEWGARP